MHWKADGATGVGNTARDGLADPPCCIRGELEAFTPVELFDGVHEAEVSFLDEIEEGKTRCLVLLCDGDHEAQV